jgi:hypothetical protein
MSAEKTNMKKSAIEQSSMMNEIIKRDNKFYAINKNFHLDLKTRMKLYTLIT